jgi:tRNA threonylcarbamoyladenosine modification (KEOPS) complex  Pcc1 subunit
VTDLQQAILDACLQLSKDAMAIFDAVEADGITLDTARAVVRMGQSANDIALGVQTMVVTGMATVRR